jgi:isoquinoline 1-oxidoreductase subunit beta
MKLVVNGAEVEVDDRHAKTPLLWVLRDVLGVHGVKFGCGAGFCAACTVLIDGRNQKSCQTATERAVGRQVVTVEAASGPVVDAVRDAWHRRIVVQCGYCQPGQTLAAVALLESNAAPDDGAIDDWMSGNLCRCGTYTRIRDAIHDAGGMLAAGNDPGPLAAPPKPEVHRLTPEEIADPVHPYVRVREDGTVVVFSTQIEMGQGIHTGFATLAAEELDADFDSVRVVNAANGVGPSGDVYGNPDTGGAFQVAGASNSMKGSFFRYRRAGAQARARLVAAAGEAWQVPAEEVEVDRGVLSHASGRRASFGELAARAERLPVPEDVRLKDPSEFNLIGHEGRLRVDSPDKILGRTMFTIDVSLPGMVEAIVMHPPRFGAKVASVDDEAALAEPGVIDVVPIDACVTVVGETVADAQRGLRALNVSWDESGAERRSSSELMAEHLRLLESGEQAVVSRDDGDVDAALEAAQTTIDATYTLPYLIESTKPPTGVGEVSVPFAAPALTNADVPLRVLLEQAVLRWHPRHDRLRRHRGELIGARLPTFEPSSPASTSLEA